MRELYAQDDARGIRDCTDRRDAGARKKQITSAQKARSDILFEIDHIIGVAGKRPSTPTRRRRPIQQRRSNRQQRERAIPL
jgi:hypothetical protein